MTEAQIDQFYDTVNPENSTNQTFGNILASTLAIISDQFKCRSPLNCSEEELAYKQWGSSNVTYNPPIIDTDWTYTP